jgi:predicted RNase H-like HicB family nuclease
MSAASVFVSYSHKDRAWKDKLLAQFAVLEKHNLITAWNDALIQAGQDWLPEIEKALAQARAAVLLVSADSLSSGFILREEVSRLLQRRQDEGLRLVPLIVRPCPWKLIPWLAPITARPMDGRPLSALGKPRAEAALASLAEEIHSLIFAPAHAPRPSRAPGPVAGKKRKDMTATAETLSSVTFQFTRQDDGTYLVTSPEIPELLTEGNTLKEAIETLPAVFEAVEAFRAEKPAILRELLSRKRRRN